MDNRRKNSSIHRRVEYAHDKNSKRRAVRSYGGASEHTEARRTAAESVTRSSHTRRESRYDPGAFRGGDVYFTGSGRYGRGPEPATPYRTSRDETAKRHVTDADRRRRIEETRARARQRTQRLRAAAILFISAAAAVILLFMTPIFDIAEIKFSGNSAVTKDEIEAKVGYLIGKNLFSSGSGRIREEMLSIPEVDDVEVSKKLFPPSVVLEITETHPAAYMLSANKVVVINSAMRVIDDSGSVPTDTIPSVSGISIPSYEMGSIITSDSAEKDDILKTMLVSFEDTGLLGSITYISLDDLSNIKFNYENRIECECGSQLELTRKIRMFAETINSSSIDGNTRGTMDLGTPGQAVLQP